MTLDRVLAPLTGPAHAALRIVSGLMFASHGLDKHLGWFGVTPAPPPGSQVWIGGVIEIVAGLLIALGLFTRLAAFLASGTMAVAYVQFHWKLAFDGGFFPIVNKGELALLYAFVFLYLACAGPGPFGLDGALRRRKFAGFVHRPEARP